MNAFDDDAALSQIAGAIAEPARTKMLCALMDGHARTSTEMAVIAGVSTSTASAHLARLKDDGLLKLHTQGRHRYYSLAGAHVAQAIEGLMVISRNTAQAFVPNTPNRLQLARTCYDHMAGTLAVQLHDHFIASGWLVGDGTYALTAPGETAMIALGLDLPAVRAQRRRFACACLDWSMRRPHLAGALGAAVLQCAIHRGWVTQDLDSRALGVTANGRKAFAARFGVEWLKQEPDQVQSKSLST
ncbi:helix-turn-helix transcriptional regulator [Pseudomonas sp. 58 R 3]|uniref:ArsR/SmtB family transcription factor n=1 Tax=Pseudomonas sp. 58 R 3 TaxID=1844108 RepID=UPI0008122E46|nr:helix-turn-helix transcriptional regulator [Pseudomonas sp. 58 R 3]CRM21864.1 HTH-type transcriptional regulator CmtR [Pseudomonas sp. 58 R 3]